MDAEQGNKLIEQLKTACPAHEKMSKLYFTGSGDEASKVFEKATGAYARLQSDEMPLACLSSGSGDEGFVLTTKRIYLRDEEKKAGAALPEEVVDVRVATIENTMMQVLLGRVLVFTPQHARPYFILTADKEEAVELLRAWKQIVATPAETNNSVKQFTRFAGEWGFITRWALVGRHFTEVYANQDIISIEQYKQFLFTFGKQQSTVDLKNVTSVTREKKLAKSSIYLIILGLVGLFVIIGIIPLLIGLFTLREKRIKIVSPNGTASIPDMPSDEMMNDLIGYIRERNPNAVKV